MMKILKWCMATLFIPMMVACFSDDTTDANRPLSYITIESGIDSIYNIDKNETLKVTPTVTQQHKDKPLNYTWEVDLKPYSHDKEFSFLGTALGMYQCRLIVENEDGKSFFPFIVYVNSPYEEGITVLSRDAEGNSMLSFMQTPDEGETGQFTQDDCFALNNPDMPFAAGASDIVQSSGSLIVACQGGGERGDLPTVYYLNEKTLVVENMFTVPEYDDFKPTKLGIPATGYAGTSYPVLCENGKVYEFSTTEAAVAKPRKLQSSYAQSCIVTSSANSYEILLWDQENQGLSQIYNGYGPYYCSTEYHLMLTNPEFAKKNYFANRNLVAMTKVHMTKSQKTEAGNREEILVLTNVANTVITRSEVLHSDFWGYDFEEMKPTFVTSATTQGALFNSPLTPETPCIANKTFYSLLFARDNKVCRWNYNTNLSELSSAPVLLELEEGAVITDFEISADHTRTYVAFYHPDREGLNGSVWVFDTDKGGEPLEQYNNICYRPVKMFYKKK